MVYLLMFQDITSAWAIPVCDVRMAQICPSPLKVSKSKNGVSWSVRFIRSISNKNTFILTQEYELGRVYAIAGPNFANTTTAIVAAACGRGSLNSRLYARILGERIWYQTKIGDNLRAAFRSWASNHEVAIPLFLVFPSKTN